MQVRHHLRNFRYLILEKKALLYNHPFWKNWNSNENPIFASTKKKILDYLKEHPEQLIYHEAGK